MKKLFITLCGAAVLSGLSSIAIAKECNCRPQMSPEVKAKMEQKKAEFDKRLNLTPEQKEKMKAIHEQSKTKMKPLFEKAKIEKDKLKQLKQSGASEQELQAQHAKIKAIKENIRAIQKENFQQVQSILTPEQQKEFNKIHEEHKQQMKNNPKFKNKKFPKQEK